MLSKITLSISLLDEYHNLGGLFHLFTIDLIQILKKNILIVFGLSIYPNLF